MGPGAVNLLDHGAVADWNGLSGAGAIAGTDNREAFQRAICTAIAERKPLYIPAGRYLIRRTDRTEWEVSLCVAGGPLHVYGDGIDATFVKFENHDAAELLPGDWDAIRTADPTGEAKPGVPATIETHLCPDLDDLCPDRFEAIRAAEPGGIDLTLEAMTLEGPHRIDQRGPWPDTKAFYLLRTGPSSADPQSRPLATTPHGSRVLRCAHRQ